MREIAFDASPGEIRALLFDDGVPVECHIRREIWAPLGTIADARLISKQGTRQFLRLDSGEDVLLPVPVSESEGALIRVEIVRERIGGPGAPKLAVARRSDEAPRAISAAAWRDSLAVRAERVISACEAIDDVCETALAGRVTRDGVTIWYERTRAGLIFDVDGTAAPLATNLVAASEIARLLRLFQIGGAVMIDFVSMDSKAARLEVAAAFDAASRDDKRPSERTAINGFGLMQVIRPCPRPSLLDLLLGRNRLAADEESGALALLRAASRTTGPGTRRCHALPAVAALLARPPWPTLVAEAARLAGAPIEIVADRDASGYGHVHVASR